MRSSHTFVFVLAAAAALLVTPTSPHAAPAAPVLRTLTPGEWAVRAMLDQRVGLHLGVLRAQAEARAGAVAAR